MPDIFVNYRTGDEEATATLIAHELSSRFGDDRIFRASKSIRPGQAFPQELLTAVRRSSVLLAVIGPRWSEAATRDGRRALEDPQDWTRREILEAFESGAHVIPVLVGRTTRLDRTSLPHELQELADRQYRRFHHRNSESDLKRIGDDLAELLPQLAAADKKAAAGADPAPPQERAGTARMQVRDVRHRQRGGIGNLNGDLGTFVSESAGPVHTGSGSQYNGPTFSGDGMGVNYVAGDNSGGMRQSVDRAEPRKDDE
ncbi:toll/interleukin-1 receptor domain-containing protein [Streptomyces sp. NBC_00091]|uniref:toll/interleukin-1 receptor domain-containing protein n=1 Tax=Streptomyces sp. NBC_00091 TaxID=2975648 RepID=UPI002254B2DE|nr:toll/interleukin-1 receptor domain-containing protein [Streptomyces sp. NBC_00091]MCX5375859.1 toll/interleukin-1 receptor domain-containing protein [Streptomyces sp. NBC_00091]